MTVNHLTTLGAIRALRTLAQDARMLNWEADDTLNFAADELERQLLALQKYETDDVRYLKRLAEKDAELERLSAPEPPKGRTVRVRIACAVEPDGSWFSFGTDNMPDPMSVAKVAAGQHGRAHWITADLPIPEPVEVQGRVE